MDLPARLEAATAALLALRCSEHLPDASRGRWLRAVPRILVQFALDDEASRWPEPTASRLAIMTETLAALDELRDRDDDAFQVVLMMALVHPGTGGRLMGVNDIARALELHPAAVMAAHRRGMAALPALLDQQAAVPA